MKKYCIDWNEEDKNLICHRSFNSLIKTFLEVYGAREFIIYNNRLCIVGSNWLHNNYDYDFFLMINQFLTKNRLLNLQNFFVIQN